MTTVTRSGDEPGSCLWTSTSQPTDPVDNAVALLMTSLSEPGSCAILGMAVGQPHPG